MSTVPGEQHKNQPSEKGKGAKTDLNPNSYPGLTPAKLSVLSCLLDRSGGTKPQAEELVNGAIAIWNAANKALGVKEKGAQESQQSKHTERLKSGLISFKDMAEEELVPKHHGEGFITSEKGIKGAVEAYYESLEKHFDQAFEHRMMPADRKDRLKTQLAEQRDGNVQKGVFPYPAISFFRAFQHSRKGHNPDAKEYTAILNQNIGEIGRPSAELR